MPLSQVMVILVAVVSVTTGVPGGFGKAVVGDNVVNTGTSKQLKYGLVLISIDQRTLDSIDSYT